MASTDEKIFNGEDLETYSALVKQEILDVEDLLPLIVNFTENNDVVTCDTNIADIYTAYSAGRDVVGHVSQGQINLFICIENAVAFYWIYGNAVNYIIGSTNNNMDSWSHDIVYIQYKLTFDSTPTANSENPVESGGIKSAIDDVKTLVVNVTATGQYTGTIDKTPTEINSAYNEGKLVLYKIPPSLGSRTFILMRKFSSSSNTYYIAVSCDDSVVATLTHMNDSTSVTLAYTDIAAGATAYQKPSTGIPKSDLEQSVQTSLDKADTALLQHQDLSSYADGAEYDSTNHLIYLKHGNTRLANPVDATDFIKDGMVDTVEVTGGNLVITFNTDSGKEDIEIPISDIFDANNYYTKTESDNRYLLSFTETDPIYSASVAAGITSSDITNWNNKLDSYTETDPTVPSWAKQSTKPSYTASEVGALPSDTHIPNDIKVGSVAGKLYRNNVGGTGNFSISGNSGCIPNLIAGTFLVAIYAKSATQSYTFRFNFGSTTYDLSTTNGEINDLRTVTISSAATFSGSVVNASGVASGTILYVTMYNYLTPIQTVGPAAVTNRYSDLDGTPTIPTVNNGTLTIQKNGTNVATFTANQSGSSTANITVPTKVSELNNDSGFITGYTETDPTVPSWAKLSTKPSYDYSEINNTPTLATVATSGSYNDLSNTPTIPTVPTNVSAFNNDAGYLTTHLDISGKQDVLTPGDGIAIDNTNTIRTTGIPYGECDSTSTSTVFTATVPGIYKLEDGVCCIVKNGVVTSAANFTLNINGLGAKPSYNNMTTGNDVTPTAPTRDTTIFNINYAMLFIYSETIVEGGAWICYRGYDANTNTIGYQVRSNSYSLPASLKFYRYRLLFTSADGTHYVPANTSTSTNATASRTVNQTPIDPFGPIVYYGATAAVEANARPAAANLWIIYTLTLGYSFNRTGAALTLTSWKPIYIKCAPQADGSAIMDDTTPYVQDLPSTADGKIYIFLGVAYSATSIELLNNHPVYYHDGTGIRLWTGTTMPTVPTNISAFNNDVGYLTSYTETDPTVPAWAKQSTKPTYTASEVGAAENIPEVSTIPQLLSPNTMYNFGTVSSALTIPDLDSTGLITGCVNFYALYFTSSIDMLSITLPTGVDADEIPEIYTGDYIEINIINNKAAIKVWKAS